jgi:NADH:ubiquinone oxidoreductase subunit 3 (subunit A)
MTCSLLTIRFLLFLPLLLLLLYRLIARMPDSRAKADAYEAISCPWEDACMMSHLMQLAHNTIPLIFSRCCCCCCHRLIARMPDSRAKADAYEAISCPREDA